MKKFLKWFLIITVILIVIGAIGSAGDKKGDSSVNEAFNKGMNEAKKTVESTQAPTTPEQKIEAKVRASLSDDKKIKSISVTEQVNGGYGVFTIINAGDNLSDDLIKKGIWLDMSKIYTALYKEPMDVATASVVANMDLTDKYGKTSNQAVMKTTLPKDEAQKVNWNQAEAMLGLQILPNVWTYGTNVFK